jgi:hypothetical protein
MSDTQILKTTDLLGDYLRSNTDPDLDDLFNRLEEKSKHIHYTQWEADRDIKAIQAGIEREKYIESQSQTPEEIAAILAAASAAAKERRLAAEQEDNDDDDDDDTAEVPAVV